MPNAGAASRSEVTDRMLVAESRHLPTVLDEYLEHYNQQRPHHARSLRTPDIDDTTTIPITDLTTTRIRQRKISDGLINEYRRTA
jgi:hypothetical protein